MKTCTRCGEHKSLDDYYTDKNARDQRKSECKVCTKKLTRAYEVSHKDEVNARARRRYAVVGNTEPKRAASRKWRKGNPEALKLSSRNTKLKLKYGVTRRQLDDIYAHQRGECAVCRRQISWDSTEKNTKPHIDHCHETGVVRGLLCLTCNTGIGMLGDSVSLLDAAKSYLLQYAPTTRNIGQPDVRPASDSAASTCHESSMDETATVH